MEKIIEMKLDRSETLLKTEQWIAFVLRYGVILSAAIISLGLVLRVFHLAPADGDSGQIVMDLTSGIVSKSIPVPQSLSDLMVGLNHINPDVIISLGLLVLIALPVLRVSMTWCFL